jgi:hypothetical protein
MARPVEQLGLGVITTRSQLRSIARTMRVPDDLR